MSVIVGVIGTMVWDTIWREGAVRSPVEEWGGISYALAAADALDASEFKYRPVLMLGRDLAERGYRFLRELKAIESYDAISVVDEPNTRVELRYRGRERRCERIGGVTPSWTWPELEPAIRGCDALYVNFITGAEFDLSTAKQLRVGFDGPIYADIHSLMMATGPGGERSLRPLKDALDWLGCFDVVQVNEDELKQLSVGCADPWEFAHSVVNDQTKLLFITLGSAGAAYIASSEIPPLIAGAARQPGSSGLLRAGRVGVEPADDGDPTGCGDVWGITAFRFLLAGAEIEEAMRRACDLARRNVAHRGASGLSRYLRRQIDVADRKARG